MRPRRSRGGGWYSQHTLPFLSIMLGLISVMALASMGLTSVNRIEHRKQQYVKLANIPPNFIPIHIVCNKTGYRWRKGTEWNDISIGATLEGANKIGTNASEFFNFIADSATANRKLSYQSKQNTIILWIRPDGILNATFLESLIHKTQLPIRIGKLPLQINEAVKL